ncbi:MAG: DNA polymerase III subunit beta [Rhizobiaceae bacterium]|nr:DNA polymerase III subunit beta [Rhizobiaceae bacterium]
MRVTLEQSSLMKSLGHVHRVVERRNTIPILSNVLLRADGNSLHLKATDLDLEVFEKTPAVVEQAGATTVPAYMLYEIVRKLPGGSEVMLSIDADSSTLKITSGRSNFTLQMLPVEDFPDISTGEFSHSFTMATGEIRKLIEHTQFAISTEETRYYLNGIFLHTVEEEGETLLRAVATDGHRLARSQSMAPDGAAGMPGIIIPRKTVGEVQRLVEDPDAAVMVELSDSKIRMSVGETVLTSKLIDGTFPDYNRVIPTGNDKELILDRETFAKAVDRVSTISSERGRAVKLQLSDGQMVLSVNNPDSGTAEEEIAVGYSSDALDVGFNSRYLLDITNQLSGDEAKFMLSDPGSPTLIHDTNESGAIYVLMPMRV